MPFIKGMGKVPNHKVPKVRAERKRRKAQRSADKARFVAEREAASEALKPHSKDYRKALKF